MFAYLLFRLGAEVLLLDFSQLAQMIFQLVRFQLLKVILTQNHVLDKLSNFLVELNNIRFLMNKILNLLPILEHQIVVHFLRTTSERIDEFAEHRCG